MSDSRSKTRAFPESESKTTGGGVNKSGRSGGKPAHQRYNSAHRWLENKERRIAKEARRQARLKARRIRIDQAKMQERVATA